MSRRYTFKRKLLNLILVFGLGLLLTIVLGSMNGKKVLAFNLGNGIGPNAPQTGSADIVGGATTVQPWFAVGEGGYDGPVSYAKVYVPIGYGAVLHVENGDGVCPIDVGNPQVNYVIRYLKSDETVNSITSNPKGNAGNCGEITFNLTGQSAISNRIGHEGYRVYYFEAQLIPSGIGDNEKNFRLHVTTNNGGPNSLVGVSRKAVGYNKPWFGIYFRNAPNITNGGTNWNYAVEFAPYCANETNIADPAQVKIHDIDWQVYSQPNLRGLIDKDNRADATFNWGLAPPGHNPGINAVTSERIASGGSSNDWPVGNDTDTQLDFKYNNSNRYLLEFKDINWHNTIQVALPFDQFDTLQSVGTACAPDFVCTATGIDATHVRVTITNKGQYPLGKGFQLRQTPDTMWQAGQPQTNQYREWPIPPGFTANFQPGGSASFTYTRPPDNIENYVFYDDTGNGANVVPFENNAPCTSSGYTIVTCSGSSAPNPAEVGQPGQFKFTFHAVNTTPNNVPVTYGYTPNPSFTVTSGPTPPSGIIAHTSSAGVDIPQPPPLVFTAQINSSGTFIATATYNGISATCSQPFTAAALPYFQVWNSDVSAGGGFASPTGNPAPSVLGTCGGSGYISPANGSAGGNNAGGIRAFGSPYSRGSRSDFGALAMGLIPSDSTHGIGFWTGFNHQSMFANTGPGFNYGANPPGGFLNGSPQNGYGCTKDYFTDTQANPQPYSGDLQNDINNNCPNNRCQFIANSNTQINAANVPDGKQVTLYVNGNVTITGNIDLSNPGFDPTNPANIPYFNLIVKGNIILTEGVNRLYGVYIAQPANSGGIFATCNNGPNAQDITADTNACTRQLIVNGAVIAQHVELLRSHGTLHTPSPDPNGISGNPAEIFNYVPSLLIGNPALSTQPGTIEGIFSLSPVF